jgi:hypothetical protein
LQEQKWAAKNKKPEIFLQKPENELKPEKELF